MIEKLFYFNFQFQRDFLFEIRGIQAFTIFLLFMMLSALYLILPNNKITFGMFESLNEV